MNQRPTVLIVDDERTTREGIRRALRLNYDVLVAESGDEALSLLAQNPVDAMLSDVRMPGMDGLTLLRRVHAQYPSVVCILLTAYGNVDTAVEAMKDGASDFLTKPVNLDHLEMVIQRTLHNSAIQGENESLRRQLDDKYGMENILGDSPAMQPVFDRIRQAAPTNATVLIQGPSGTGKELVAHALHQLSPRAKAPFVAVHCAALSSTLLESELFGHEQGAFTGAISRRKGRFELADGGTLFLDEISEIDPATQIKLLRVLEDRKFERVGGDETLEVDIRVVAATNRNLRQYVAEGKFREDLYYRLAVVDIQLPPLRERGSDIAILAMHYLTEAASKNGRHITSIAPDAMDVLQRYPWPGNVRELRNAMEKMVVFARGERITLQDVPRELFPSADAPAPAPVATAPAAVVSAPAPANTAPATMPPPPNTSLADAMKVQILNVLRECGGNRSRAAERLGISRRTLHRRLKEWDIPAKQL